MITIIKNKNNLSETDITDVVKRVKAIIVNSKNEILLGFSHLEYQFPGGHVEDKECLNVALKRELKEETGLDYEVEGIEPIGVAIRFYKDYPNVGRNSKHVIYYYEIKSDAIPDVKQMHLTEEEIDGKYVLRYINLDDVTDVIRENALLNGDSCGIAGEMLEFFSEYLK